MPEQQQPVRQMTQRHLTFDLKNERVTSPTRRAIEQENFPFEFLSQVAEAESWRKEVFRPVYHVHKWWAQRLGSVFRGILLGAFLEHPEEIEQKFYTNVRFPNVTVFDPFMGSGTTVGESLKLGTQAIGRDINWVSYFAVRTALETHPKEQVIQTFNDLEEKYASNIKRFYKCKSRGSVCDVLYYFWVKYLFCPNCRSRVDLFPKYIFSQHAYPKKYPTAKCVCPRCDRINSVRYDARTVNCSGCDFEFDPKSGPASGSKACCPDCGSTFSLSKTAQEQGHPPAQRMYAKLVLLPDGTKEYQEVDDYDRSLYEEARTALASRPYGYPINPIEPGHNTNQVLNYRYTYWHEMFNARQLLCLGILGDAIREIESPNLRDAMACLFSGTLEFNNTFASFKGEGTGAVRHMFYHHILKPERMPLEANIWGTPKSSGSFSTMFKTRLLKALEYCEDPFELKIENGKTAKVYGISSALGHLRADTYSEFSSDRPLYLSCGDSASTDIPSKSLDLILTDPPFFDNVNYSQLADFFYVWLRYVLKHEACASTRSDKEVQHSDASTFSERLGNVFVECNRTLKDDGRLIFTYHHARSEGWSSVLKALNVAGFEITAAQPVKAEMSSAAPKNQAREPIDLDIIIVCRKRAESEKEADITLSDAETVAAHQVKRFRKVGRRLSRNDVKVILMGQYLRVLSSERKTEHPEDFVGQEVVEKAINQLHCEGV